MRYYLLDRITSFELGREARGVKCVTLTDEVLHDHFPAHPIFPGALLTEAMAQLAGFLVESTGNADETQPVRRAVLGQIEKMKFLAPFVPGDRIELRAQMESFLPDAAQVSVEASSEGSVRARGRLTFALLPIGSESLTRQRMEIYAIWTEGLANRPLIR